LSPESSESIFSTENTASEDSESIFSTEKAASESSESIFSTEKAASENSESIFSTEKAASESSESIFSTGEPVSEYPARRSLKYLACNIIIYIKNVILGFRRKDNIVSFHTARQVFA
jgi:hypothetical protein